MLNNFLEEEKANKKDERPLQYAEDADTTAFCPNTQRMMFRDSTNMHYS